MKDINKYIFNNNFNKLSMFNEKSIEHYKKNKNEIFDYYKSKILLDELIEEPDKIIINNLSQYRWNLNIKTEDDSAKVIITIDGRQDIYYIEYILVMNINRIINVTNIKEYISYCNIVLREKLNKVLLKFKIQNRITDCNINLYHSLDINGLIRGQIMTNIKVNIISMPKLDDFKQLEHIVHKTVCDNLIVMDYC